MIDWTKPIRTVDGKKARYVTDLIGRSDCKLVVILDGEHEFSGAFYPNGKQYDGIDCPNDLVNIDEREQLIAELEEIRSGLFDFDFKLKTIDFTIEYLKGLAP